MKTAIIVESPTKAAKIQKFFTDGTKVTSSYGHIYDLPKGEISIDIENNFKPNYKPINGKEKIIKNLRNLSKNYNILLAADDDREGDAIAWHCGKVMKLNFNNQNRIIFREISKKAVLNGIEKSHKLNMNSVNAQQARRIIDRLVGYSLSPCLWKNIQTKTRGLSAGRVQSTVLKILKEHEDSIDNFEPEYSYDFTGDFTFSDNEKINCDLLFITDNEIEPISILNILKNNKEYFINKKIRKEEKRYPGQTLITTTLQQAAQNELGLNVKTTMNIAQKLFDNGKITYMRTDSTYISEEFQRTIERKVSNEYSEEYYKKFECKKKKIKGAQEAHECIRPTDINHKLNDKWSEIEKKLYNLIVKKTIISHMKPAIYDILTIDLSNENLKDLGIFKGKFKSLKFEGFLIYDNHRVEEFIDLSNDTKFNLQRCICIDNETQPPNYLNETMLVKKLESLGIGRPSTYAAIIDTILNRNYTIVSNIPEKIIKIDTFELDNNNKIKEYQSDKKIAIQKNKIKLTELGKQVLEYLVKNFLNIVDVNFTSLIESDLDKIAEGEYNWVDIVKKVYDSFYKDVKIQMNNSIKKNSIEIKLGNYKGKEVIIKNGPYGYYVNYNGKNNSLKYILKSKKISDIKIENIHNLLK